MFALMRVLRAPPLPRPPALLPPVPSPASIPRTPHVAFPPSHLSHPHQHQHAHQPSLSLSPAQLHPPLRSDTTPATQAPPTQAPPTQPPPTQPPPTTATPTTHQALSTQTAPAATHHQSPPTPTTHQTLSTQTTPATTHHQSPPTPTTHQTLSTQTTPAKTHHPPPIPTTHAHPIPLPLPPLPSWHTGASIGVVSSFLGASAGVGGALFSIPMMCHFAHFSQRLAAGTALFAVVGVSSAGAYVFSQADQIDVPAALYLSASAAVFSPLGVIVSRSASPHVLRQTLGIFLMAVAPLMPVRTALQNGYFRRSDQQHNHTDPTPTSTNTTTTEPPFSLAHAHLPTLIVAGSSVGFISGLLGVGGGTLFTPTIAFLAGDRYADFHTVLGTSFLAMTLPAVTGAISYWRMGHASMAIVPSLCLGTMVGATVGSRFALTVPEDKLRAAFAVIFSILGWRIFRSRRLLSTNGPK